MTGLGRLLLALLRGLLLRRLLLLGSRPAPRRRLSLLLIERDGTGAKASDVHEVGRRDSELLGGLEEPGDRRRPSRRFHLAKIPFATPAGCCPFEREARLVPGGSDVLADQFQEAFGVHPRDFAISPASALAHSRVPYFIVDQCSGWRCTWATMGGFCS